MALTKVQCFVIFKHFDMLRRSHTCHILILFFNIRDKEIYNPFELVPLFKRFTYKNKTQTCMS